MSWFTVLKKDKKDMRVDRVYPSDRSGKKIMMLTHEGKKIHAGAKGMGNWKGKGKNRGGGTHKNPKRRANFRANLSAAFMPLQDIKLMLLSSNKASVI